MSQFFSGIYLIILDDAFANMHVSYFRYQDDILILCKTKRQLNRCKQRMLQILRIRKLHLSSRKTTMGHITNGFHFLGIDYSVTQTQDNTDIIRDEVTTKKQSISNVNNMRGGKYIADKSDTTLKISPHARTLRKAREQIKCMVADNVSLPKIRRYLSRWAYWWAISSDCWQYEQVLQWFINVCRDKTVATIANKLLASHLA